MVLVTWIIISLFTFTRADTDIFKLETEMPQAEKIDLLTSDDINPDLDFSLERIITGNFSPDGSVNSILLERHTSFSTKSSNYFRFRYGILDSNGFTVTANGIMLEGNPLNLIAGDINGDGVDETVLHWMDSKSRIWIQVVVQSGIADYLFPPHRVDPNRIEEVTLADMDGNGKLDIVVPSFKKDDNPTGIDKIIVYFHLGDRIQKESYAIIPAPVIDLTVTDTNDDGRDEIITLRSIKQGQFSQAIWSIMRRDDGSYAERPIAKGNSMTLAPPPLSGGKLFYTRKSAPTGRFFNVISTIDFEGDDFKQVNECKLLPEGLILEQIWGHFSADPAESLAVIVDESMIARRWLLIYTPFKSRRVLNKITLITDDGFYPNGSGALAFDLDKDGIDELVYVDNDGKPYALNLLTRQSELIKIND